MTKKYLRFVTAIPGWLSKNEGSFLEQAARETEMLKGVVVEIGSFQGKSTIWLAQAQKKVYAIDPHNGHVSKKMRFPETFRKFKENLIKAQVSKKVTPIRKTSIEASKDWKLPIRVLFIDALHDEKNALRDFQTWSKFVVDGGIIAVHDSFLHWCGSEKVALKHIINAKEFNNIGFCGSILYGQKTTKRRVLSDYLMQAFINTAIFFNHLFILLKSPFESKKTIQNERTFSCL